MQGILLNIEGSHSLSLVCVCIYLHACSYVWLQEYKCVCDIHRTVMAASLQAQHTLIFIIKTKMFNFIYIHSIYFISSSRPISTPSLILASFSLVMFTYICISISIHEYLCLCMYVCMNEYVNGTSRVHLL